MGTQTNTYTDTFIHRHTDKHRYTDTQIHRYTRKLEMKIISTILKHNNTRKRKERTVLLAILSSIIGKKTVETVSEIDSRNAFSVAMVARTARARRRTVRFEG
jgi:hypothetical protein